MSDAWVDDLLRSADPVPPDRLERLDEVVARSPIVDDVVAEVVRRDGVRASPVARARRRSPVVRRAGFVAAVAAVAVVVAGVGVSRLSREEPLVAVADPAEASASVVESPVGVGAGDRDADEADVLVVDGDPTGDGPGASGASGGTGADTAAVATAETVGDTLVGEMPDGDRLPSGAAPTGAESLGGGAPVGDRVPTTSARLDPASGETADRATGDDRAEPSRATAGAEATPGDRSTTDPGPPVSGPAGPDTTTVASTTSAAPPSTEAEADDACTAEGPTYADAVLAYARTCVEVRVDCDPIEGRWRCSSEPIGALWPGAPGNGQQRD
ncbi:MAG: hypothetical protein AAGA93_23515 [Actinomycetota bacterium]